jgi:hypothetical protein
MENDEIFVLLTSFPSLIHFVHHQFHLYKHIYMFSCLHINISTEETFLWKNDVLLKLHAKYGFVIDRDKNVTIRVLPAILTLKILDIFPTECVYLCVLKI